MINGLMENNQNERECLHNFRLFSPAHIEREVRFGIFGDSEDFLE